MSVNHGNINSKGEHSKMNTQIYSSPLTQKKKSIGNLYTEPRKNPIENEIYSKNKTKQKISNTVLNKNIINIHYQDVLRKSSKLLTEMNDKSVINKNMPQSYKKIPSKLYLKKNVIPNISSFNDTNTNSNTGTTKLGTNSNMNTNNDNSSNNKYIKNRITGIKFNMGKNSQNSYKDSLNNNLKKSSGSAIEIFSNNYLKKNKTKTKNFSELNNINSIGNMLTNNYNNNKAFLSPQNVPGQKMIFFKKDNSKLKDKYIGHNVSKDSLKVIPSQNIEQINNKINTDKNKKGVQYLLRNKYNDDVKKFPTTFLNNKINYQTQNNSNMNNNISNNANSINSSININSSKIKKDKIIVIDTIDKKNKNTISYNNAQSVEEVHYLYVNTIQNGKNLILKMEKSNS